MLFHGGKGYYPLEITRVISGDGSEIYNRDKRGMSYVYIDLRTQSSADEDE